VEPVNLIMYMNIFPFISRCGFLCEAGASFFLRHIEKILADLPEVDRPSISNWKIKRALRSPYKRPSLEPKEVQTQSDRLPAEEKPGCSGDTSRH
jgi:hypothetical protein